MALQIAPKSTHRIGKLTAAFVGIFALMLQPLIPLNIPAVFATSLVPSQTSLTLDQATGFEKSVTVATTGHQDVDISFDFDSTTLDGSQSEYFEYGYVDSTSTQVSAGSVPGASGSHSSEAGSKQFVLPTAYDDLASVELYFKAVSTAGQSSDFVEVTNITVDGDPLSSPQITSVAAVKHDAANYKGIYVETKTTDVSDAKAISVAIKRDDNTTVTKNSRPAPSGSVTGVNSGVVGTPIIIQPGTYDEASSGSWYPAPASWTDTTRPTEVTVVITLSDNSTIEKTESINISQSDYESLLPYQPSSTNDLNKTKGWAHVNEISKTTGSVTLEFVSERSFASCFEYRTDGDTSQVLAENGGNNYLPSVTDGLYPYFCQNNNSRTETISAGDYVEVRMVFGAEGDERFGWTRFDVEADTTKPTISIDPVAPKPISGIESFDITVTDDQPLDPANNKHVWVDLYGDPDWSNKKGQKVDLSNGTGTFTIDTTALPNGKYVLRVGSVKDASGNESGDKSFRHFTIDNIAPAVSNVVMNGKNVNIARDANCGPTDFNIVRGNIDLSATIVDDSGVASARYKIRKVTDGGCTQTNIYQSGTVSMNNQSGDEWVTLPAGQLDTTDVPTDGNYTIQITVKDTLGNQATKYVDITIDNTAPEVTGLSIMQDGDDVSGGITNQRQATIQWDDSTAPDFDYFEYHNRSGWHHLNVSEFSGKIGGNSGPDGLYTYQVRAIDEIGNVSEPVSVNVTLDTNAPSIPSSIFPLNGAVLKGADLYIDWGDSTDAQTDQSNIKYEYRLFLSEADADNDTNIRYSKDYTGTTRHPESGFATGTPEDAYFWKVRACDQAGNCSGWSAVREFIVDNTAPTVAIANPADNSLHNGDVALRATVTDANPHHYWLQIKKDGVAINIPGVTGTRNTTTSFTDKLLTTLTDEGSYQVTLAARDSAGGSSRSGNRSGNVVINFRIDKTAPGVPTASMTQDSDDTNVPNGGSTNSEFFTFALGSSSETTRYRVKYWNDIIGSPFKIGSPWNPASLSGHSPALGVYKDHFTQGEGTHYFSFSACDDAGNCSAYSTPFTVSFDTTAPVLILDSTPDSSSGSRTISGNSDPFADIEVTVHSTPQTKSTVADASGFWSILFEGLDFGGHTVKVVSTDAAGNSIEKTGSFTVLTPTVSSSPVTQPDNSNDGGLLGQLPGNIFDSFSVINQSPDTDSPNNGGQTGVKKTSTLGEQSDQTSGPADDTAILGAEDNKIFGLVWYWWLIALGGFVAGWLIIAAAIRRKRAEEQ